MTRSLLDRIDPDARFLVRLHATMMIVWGFLVVPTLLFWRESILWVAFMSLYANFVGHFSAWDGARAELLADENNTKAKSTAKITPK